ncbi:poly-gamma-glutamate synthesis protein (capsule biosynthesis protein) [Kutzneria sp. 744]|nr:poly-gamma-glutamate synthesis protein (capsule biosynthesis protein) [Kutzneria sp. 744]
MFLSGDVMPSRGVDQILPHPGDPSLRESYVTDARRYVDLAEAANGPIPYPVEFAWPWGDSLPALDAIAPDVRVINLESSITADGEFAPGKAVHYRMNPDNIGCLTAARPDVCALANNHVLDFGRRGLIDTLDALRGAGLCGAGAGVDIEQARRPAIVTSRGGCRVLIFACGMASSGIPADWAATADRPGICYLPDGSDREASALAGQVRAVKRPGEVVIVSVHWGANWGYQVTRDQVEFGHLLIDAGVDIVHGHSSHHPRPIEIYHDRLVLYGCGDLIDDYEGVGGYERFRDDLRLLYFVSVRPDTGALVSLRMVPVQARNLRLRRASAADAAWLRGTLERISRSFGTRLVLGSDGVLTVGRARATRS